MARDPCERCAVFAAELAQTLRELAAVREDLIDSHRHQAELLDRLREWELATATALDGKEK